MIHGTFNVDKMAWNLEGVVPQVYFDHNYLGDQWGWVYFDDSWFGMMIGPWTMSGTTTSAHFK